jgi:2'-5' RNA ligase
LLIQHYELDTNSNHFINYKRGEERYNFCQDMSSLRHALVAYVSDPIGEFVENLRRTLHPDLPYLAAHITLLPPRLLQGSESAALHVLEEICGRADPFEVSLGEMKSFIPTTPTVFIGVAEGASQMEDLHSRLNTEVLTFAEKWPYVPHLTIGTMATEPTARQALETSRKCWQQYSGSRRILIDQLTFVREESENCWVDIAPVSLGRRLLSR